MSAIQFINVPKIAEGLEITEVAPTKPLRRQTGKKHTFRQCKDLGLLDSVLIAYLYDGDGEALRYESVGIPTGQKKIIKDFLARELKPGLTKFDPDCWNYKISKTWNYYQRAKAQKLAVGKIVPWLEGEKGVEAVMQLGILGITFQGGHRQGIKLRESIQQVQDDGAALLLWCFDNDKTGREEAEIARGICAEIGLLFATFDVTKIWEECPVKGDLADYIKEFNPTKEFLINAFLEQIEEQRLAPVQQIEVNPTKAKYSPNFTGEKKEYKLAALTPEELAEKKANIIHGDYKLFDLLFNQHGNAGIQNTIKTGTKSRRHKTRVSVAASLHECNNYLTSLGITTSDTPEQLFEEWVKNSIDSSDSDRLQGAWKAFADKKNNQPYQTQIDKIDAVVLGYRLEATTKPKRIIDVEIAPVEPFKFLPLADRNDPLVKANPNAHWNRGSSSLAIAQTEDEMPIVFVSGTANAELLAKHGYFVVTLPEKPLEGYNKHYGFDKAFWDELITYLPKKGSKVKRDVYFTLNGSCDVDTDTRLRRLDEKTGCNLKVVHLTQITSIEEFNTAYSEAEDFVDYYAVKLSKPNRKPDLIIPATSKYFPSEAIKFPTGNKFAVMTGIHGAGKSHQETAQIQEATKRGIITVIFSKTIILKDQASTKKMIPTVEQVIENGYKIDGDLLAFSSCIDNPRKAESVLFHLGYLNSESPKFREIRLSFDESLQTLGHAALGTGTYVADHRASATTSLCNLIKNAAHSVLYDADIPEPLVWFFSTLTQSEPYVVQHARRSEDEQVTLWQQGSPAEMIHLGLINQMNKNPDQAFLTLEIANDVTANWTPSNTADLSALHSDRSTVVIDHEAINDPNNENFNLLSSRVEVDGKKVNKLDVQMAKYSQEKQSVFMNVASTGVSVESVFEKNFIVAPGVGNAFDIVQMARRLRPKNEKHLWVQPNNNNSYIYNSTDAREIYKYLVKADKCIAADFISRGDFLQEIPVDVIFEQFQCKLAALLNWYNKHHRKATFALFKHKWGSQLIDSSEYIKDYSEEEIAAYRQNDTELANEISEIQANRELAKNTKRVNSCDLPENEYIALKGKMEKLTEDQKDSVIKYEFKKEYEGSMPCTPEEMKDYLKLKPIKLQNQYRLLLPEADNTKLFVTAEKSAENGKRDRVDQTKKLIKGVANTELRKIGFDQFFHEIYTLIGESPFSKIQIPKIPEGQFKWVSSVSVCSKDDGTAYNNYYIDIKNPAWMNLIKYFVSLGKICRNIYGFMPVPSQKGISHYQTIKLFLENYFIDLDFSGKEYFFKIDDGRDAYFHILNKRYEDIENSDLVVGIGEGYHKPITATGEHTKAAYQYQARNPSTTETLLELIAKSKAKGLPKLEAKPANQVVQLTLNLKAPVTPVESIKQPITPEEIKQPSIGDYALVNGMLAKITSEAALGTGNFKIPGFELETTKGTKIKEAKEKIQPASVEVLSKWINTKLARHPESKD
ncbi:hypothetical protein ACOWPH_21570 [Anabaena sp. PCC 7938]